jgi:hypothetical protein
MVKKQENYVEITVNGLIYRAPKHVKAEVLAILAKWPRRPVVVAKPPESQKGKATKTTKRKKA